MTINFHLSPAFCVQNNVIILHEEKIDSKYIVTAGVKENCLEETKLKIERVFYRRFSRENGLIVFKQISNDEYDRLIAKLFASSTKKM